MAGGSVSRRSGSKAFSAASTAPVAVLNASARVSGALASAANSSATSLRTAGGAGGLVAAAGGGGAAGACVFTTAGATLVLAIGAAGFSGTGTGGASLVGVDGSGGGAVARPEAPPVGVLGGLTLITMCGSP